MDLYEEINKLIQQLDYSVKTLRTNGSELALKEHDYKIKVAQKVFELKSQGTPATLINLTIYGDKEVAKLRYERDIAETIYNANQESINSIKLKLRILENQLNREWGNTKK